MDCRSFVVGAADHQGRLALAVDLRSSVRNPALESATGVALADEGQGGPRAAAASGAMQMALRANPMCKAPAPSIRWTRPGTKSTSPFIKSALLIRKQTVLRIGKGRFWIRKYAR
jgi:hypothetical protein